ncbi:unnamed protein product [Cuscuta epithymum]|uniref:Uncharacterized protein n=1 Tax=Cuscuta epithymum TaxID=186058 RepID=A0AAV0G5R9_9ASTE|nr:unnamed protein product [Cuscuta epithymum]
MLECLGSLIRTVASLTTHFQETPSYLYRSGFVYHSLQRVQSRTSQSMSPLNWELQKVRVSPPSMILASRATCIQVNPYKCITHKAESIKPTAVHHPTEFDITLQKQKTILART